MSSREGIEVLASSMGSIEMRLFAILTNKMSESVSESRMVDANWSLHRRNFVL